MRLAALGVLGGMGPLATADFLYKLAATTPASCDQDHIPIVLHGECRTPDRTASVLGTGPSPLPQLLEGIQFLNASGCRAIAIPCNSAHCWYEKMAAASGVPVLHIVEASARQVRANDPQTKRVGVLSTEGTHRMDIYPAALQRLGLDTVSPTAEDFRTLISPAIAHIKANRIEAAQALFDTAADHLFARGAQQIVLGCTEIPLGMQARCRAEPHRIVDSTRALVTAVLEHFRRGAPSRQAC